LGCLNNFCKINSDVIHLWARILQKVGTSRLLLLADDGSHREETLNLFQRDGIDSRRIEFVSRQPARGYLKLYNRIDLGLDTFPYNGHTTSLDSFWMGVPVVTIVGQRAVGRAGWCQLSNLDLTELAGHSADEFVRIAVDVAQDLTRLEILRSSLRSKMEQSPLMNAERFTLGIESAYRSMWCSWCEREGKV
jgi:protein O-GlcNAc transferase